MKTVILEAFKDDNMGEIGLGIKGVPRDETTNAAMEGLLIAHDLIEHVNGFSRIGTIDDELEALGAIWYVRGQWGALTRDGSGWMYSIEQNIASDVTRMFRDHVDGGQYVSYEPLRTGAVYDDEALHNILEEADKKYLGEFNDDGEEDSRKEAWPAYRRQALARMRIGYSKARRKYERHGRFFANNLFWAITEAVQPYAKHVDCEGQQFKLTYGAKDGEIVAHCEELESEDY